MNRKYTRRLVPVAEIHAQARAPPGLRSSPWRGHVYGSLNEVSQGISQRSVIELLDLAGNSLSGTFWAATVWNLLEIFPLRLSGKLFMEKYPTRDILPQTIQRGALWVQLLDAECC